MKKIISSIITLSVLLLFISTPVYAASSTPQNINVTADSSIIYLEDGGKIVISPAYKASSDCTEIAAVKTVTVSRDIYCDNDNGKKEWTYTLTASFSYEYGISSTCTDASYTQVINDTHWSFSDGSATRSGNTAYWKGTYIKKELSIVVKEVNIDISLSCDIYGNVT